MTEIHPTAQTLHEIAEQLALAERRTVRRDPAGLITGFDVAKPDHEALITTAMHLVRETDTSADPLARIQVLDETSNVLRAYARHQPAGGRHRNGYLEPGSREHLLANADALAQLRDEAMEAEGYVWQSDPEPAA